MSPLLALHDAVIGYDCPLLEPLALEVRQGTRLAVLGPNGGGKSTLLRSLLGLIPLLSGKRVLVRPTLRVGYVPQSHRSDPLFPLTAEEVVLQGRFGKIGVGRPIRRSDRDAALRALTSVGLAANRAAPFRSLSGGQRQRVLLARALCGEPELLVLDEFTSDLDPAAASLLLQEISRLATELAVSVIFVTHEIADAAAWSTEVALVDTRTKVFACGATQELLTSERLSKLYGQPVEILRRDGRTFVHVAAGGVP